MHEAKRGSVVVTATTIGPRNGVGLDVIQSKVLYLFANCDVVLEVRHITVRLKKLLEMEKEENVLWWGGGARK